MIVKDERDFLKDCLQSVADVVDEILVADTGSADDTDAVARLFGARIYSYPWDQSFANARNFILGKAQCPWVLLLDADERLFEEDREKLKRFVAETPYDGAHFKVYNYVGAGGEGRYTLHNALRLVRNNGQYCFEGDIHEQLVRLDGKPVGDRFAVTDIRLHHLGYLDSVVSQKKKRERNIPMLLTQLEKDPEDAFTTFNLGNEYMAQGEYAKAMEWYHKAFARFKPHEAYGPHLIFRMAMCYYNLSQYGKAVEMLRQGLELYPGCTDMEFMRGKILMDWHRDLPAADSFQKAIAMGEPHATLRFSDDCATTRPLCALAEIYRRQQDHARAATYFVKTVQADNKLHDALYGMAQSLVKLGLAPDDIESAITGLFGTLDHTPNRMVLTDVLLSQRLCDLSLKHLKELDRTGEYSAEREMLWGKYHFYKKEYGPAIERLTRAVRGDEPPRVLPRVYGDSALLLLACMLIEKPGREGAIDNAKKAMEKAFGSLGGRLCDQISHQLSGGHENLLEGEKPQDALALLMALLRPILENGAFEVFERMLYLLNSIDSPRVLTALGGLYLEQGFAQMAVLTILRSVKELDFLDEEGAWTLAQAMSQAKNREDSQIQAG